MTNPNPNSHTPIPLSPTDNETYTYLTHRTTHIPFASLPRVLIGRKTPTLFTACIIFETREGPTVLVAPQEGSSRVDAIQKLVGLLEDLAIKKIVRAEKLDEIHGEEKGKGNGR
jgi:hypothetical protein